MGWLLLIIILILFTGYGLLIITYRKWFLNAKEFEIKNGQASSNIFFSIIIPARNEEEQIVACLQSALNQHYPPHLFEVIIIDDHSTDNTAGVVQSLQQKHSNLRLINLEQLLKGQQLNSYKKKAIELAIMQAKGDWIITTDADCVVKPTWLHTFAAFIQEKH